MEKKSCKFCKSFQNMKKTIIQVKKNENKLNQFYKKKYPENVNDESKSTKNIEKKGYP